MTRYQVAAIYGGIYYVIDTRCNFRMGPYFFRDSAQSMADLLNRGHERNQRRFSVRKLVIDTFNKLVHRTHK